MSNSQHKVQVLNAATGEEYERNMTAEEVAALPEPTEPLEEPA